MPTSARGSRARDAREETLQPHSRIDHDRHRAHSEQREHRRDQRQPLSNHHECAIAAANARACKPFAPRGDFSIQFGEIEREIIDVTAVRVRPRGIFSAGVCGWAAAISARCRAMLAFAADGGLGGDAVGHEA